MKSLQRKNTTLLVTLLVLIVAGGVLFMGAMSGWFSDKKAVLDEEYYCEDMCDGEFAELSAEQYEELVKEKKSFVVFVDQGGCTVADRLRGYVLDFAMKNKIRVYRIMFEEMRGISLHDFVKFYPSVAVISKGKVTGYLRADSDDDAAAYNNYGEFERWMGEYLR